MSDSRYSNKNTQKQIHILSALGVVAFLMIAIGVQVFVLDSAYTTQITLILATAVAAIVAMSHGYRWKEVQDGILYGCNLAMLPMLILMMVGVLIASWVASGTIPAMIYYGMMLLSPKYFLFSACLISAIGSVSTGSSWTTAATFGVGFMGVGLGLDINPAITAGAVISGAVFGDKMSPLSDSTNLAAGVGEAELFDHVKSMAYSTGPAILICLVLYYIMGYSYDTSEEVNNQQITIIMEGIASKFSLNPIVFIPPILVVGLAMKKMSGLAVMIIACFAGAFIAIGLQGEAIKDMWQYMNYGYVSNIGVENLDKLLSGGGLQNMMWTISLGFCALAMGGLLEKTKMLEVILEKIKGIVKSVPGLVTTHVFSSILANLFTASQFLAIIIPGRMFVSSYKEKKLLPQVCSRVCEDSATVTSPLIPWGLGGVYYTGVLGVATLDYLPYMFLGFLAPAMTLLLAYTNKFMFREGDIESVYTYQDNPQER